MGFFDGEGDDESRGDRGCEGPASVDAVCSISGAGASAVAAYFLMDLYPRAAARDVEGIKADMTCQKSDM